MADAILRQIETRRGFSVSYKGKTLLSTIDPLGQGERVADAAPKTEGTLYFCPSPLYGYGLERLLNNLKSGSAILCLEADEKLLDLSRKALGELLEQNPSLRLIGSSDPGLICAYIQKIWGSRYFRRLEVLRLSGGWQLFPALYEVLVQAIQRDIATDWSNAMTLMKLGRRYIRNAIRNLSLIPRAHSLGELGFGNAPVLVLGAGPSLDTTLEGLECFFGKALYEARPFRIIAVDTSLQSLKERNIKPDLVVALESQHWNLRDFIGFGSWEVPVAMDLSALPATREVLGGQIFLFATPWTRLRFFQRLKDAKLLPEIFPPLGSVGLTAMALAQRISSGIIITAGLDFSYTLDSFHARSTPGYWEKLVRQTRFRSILNADAVFRPGTFRVLSKSGVPVWSNPVMKNYQDLFKQEFAEESRIRDILGVGLPLGLQTLSLEAAFKLLQAGEDRGTLTPSKAHIRGILDNTEVFIRQEQDRLLMLRDMMDGTAPVSLETIETLLDEGDYLWAHFPECAGAGGRRPSGRDISFLKRIRTEIDPLVRLFDIALQDVRIFKNITET